MEKSIVSHTPPSGILQQMSGNVKGAIDFVPLLKSNNGSSQNIIQQEHFDQSKVLVYSERGSWLSLPSAEQHIGGWSVSPIQVYRKYLYLCMKAKAALFFVDTDEQLEQLKQIVKEDSSNITVESLKQLGFRYFLNFPVFQLSNHFAGDQRHDEHDEHDNIQSSKFMSQDSWCHHQHLCRNDLYKISVSWHDDKSFTIIWDIKGPEKDVVIKQDMRRTS